MEYQRFDKWLMLEKKRYDKWLMWAVQYPDLAKKHYPELMEELDMIMKNLSPYIVASGIERLPERFYDQKAKAERLLGATKRKMIQQNIEFIKTIFEYKPLQHEIVQAAIENVRDELVEQLQYWERELMQLQHQPIIENQSRTKKVIFEIFSNMDKKGWQYAFISEHDYNLFTDLLTNFFEYKPYTLPKTIIQLKRTCKTKVAKALGEIHKELSNENKLSTDTEYFKLIKVLSHFNKEAEGDIYKALTR